MSDLTPTEIAALEREIAEKVMGWLEWEGYWGTVETGWRWKCSDWSPWRNLIDAREVLERLEDLAQDPEDIHIWKSWNEFGPVWTVRIGGDGEQASAPGPHEGPAICLLAEKVMEGNHAQVK
jgi:hypothetical protein